MKNKVTRIVVPLLVFSISQLFYSQTRSTPAPQEPSAATKAVPMIGRLEVHKGNQISVDDRDTESGTTFLDGQTIKTSDCKTATVHLLPVGITNPAVSELGQVDLAANTTAVINYTAGSVRVTLIRGCARIRISQTIVATINTPDGVSTAATQPEPPDRRSAEACYPSNEKRDYSPTCVAPIVWWATGGAAAATALAIVRPCHRGGDPSDDKPPGRCR